MKDNKLEKLYLLFTTVSHAKTHIFVDFLEQNGCNAQLLIRGEGMHPKKFQDVLNYNKKEVILSFISEDKAKTIIRKLEDKFENVKYCFGACWTIPLSSIIGVQTYKFLVDYRKGVQ